MLFRFIQILATLIAVTAPGASNPVAVPYANDFDGTDASDFFCPTGNGYNWGWDWRQGNFQSWVTATSRTVTATMEARALGGPPATATDFLLRVTVDPLTVTGTRREHRLRRVRVERDPLLVLPRRRSPRHQPHPPPQGRRRKHLLRPRA